MSDALLTKKLCVDCEFHRRKASGYFDWDFCTHPSAAYHVGDVVTGFSRQHSECKDMRADAKKCGVDAQWFAPRRSAITRWLDFNERFRT